MRARRITIVAVLATAGLLAAACGGSSTTTPSSNAAAPSGTLTIDNESGGTWACIFNPFNLSYISYSLGNVYEPLMFVNTLQNAKVSPWLATSYAWSNGNKTLTFTIRNGVKFTNGDPAARRRTSSTPPTRTTGSRACRRSARSTTPRS